MLLPRFWGRGLGAEAVAAVLRCVAAQTDDDHVVAVTQAANQHSLRLAFLERERFVEYGAVQVLSSVPISRPGAAMSRVGTGA